MKDQSGLTLVKKEKQRFFSQHFCLGPTSVISKETLLACLPFFPRMLLSALPRVQRNLHLHCLVNNLKACLSLSVCTQITSVSFTPASFLYEYSRDWSGAMRRAVSSCRVLTWWESSTQMMRDWKSTLTTEFRIHVACTGAKLSSFNPGCTPQVV